MNNIILKQASGTVKDFIDKLPIINLQPQYQREFIYNFKDQAKVIDSILLNLPLNSIYLNELNNDTYEVIDGQQRLTSIKNIIKHSAALIEMSNTDLNNKVGQGIGIENQNLILKYPLDIYIVTKENDSQVKYGMFKRINTVGSQLNKTELLNATYSGIFVNNLKKFCHDNNTKLNSITGKGGLRAETEEIILKGFANLDNKFANDEEVALFLADNQYNETLDYLKKAVKITNGIESITEKKTRAKIYNPLECRYLYNKYSNLTFDKDELFEVCGALYGHPEVQNKRGILEYSLDYVNKLDENNQLLNLRTFSSDLKPVMAQRQDFKCAKCGKDLSDDKEYRISELDHIISGKDGGLTETANCQLLCQKCNREKGAN